MATYTDNYQLTLPGYADVVDVADLNHNATIIDEIMHGSQDSLAPGYDAAETYNTGAVVMYGFKMYKCLADGVTGAWDPTKWEPTTASETGGGGSVDFDLYGTASGSPASFVNGAAAELVKCETDLEASQDLHGYAAPWPGGSKKNKLQNKNPVGITTISNVTFETYEDGSVYVHGTNNQGSTLSFFMGITVDGLDLSLPAGEYILTGCPSGGSSSTYFQSLYYGNMASNNFNAFDFGSGQTYTLDSSTNTGLGVRIGIINGKSVDDVFYPMLRPSSEAAGFEPWANICPISGHSSAAITVSPTSDPAQGTTKTIPFGSTVYGGTLETQTGKLTLTHKGVDLGDLTWISASIGTEYRFYTEDLIPEIEGVDSSAVIADIICTNYETLSFNSILNKNTGIYETSNKTVGIYDPQYSTMTAQQFQAAMDGVFLVYPLETPQTVQLTPAQVASVLGQNYVSSDTGAVDIIYVKSGTPIKPNPTGAASGALNKIELDGEVFEISGGGATNVLGAFIDTDNVITTLTGSGSGDTFQDYTAAADCAIIGMIKGDSAAVQINGETVAYTSDATETIGVCVYAKQGQTVSYRMISSSILTVYGLQYGSVTVPQVHYSENEQAIGTDEDGKTIYEKTFLISSPTWTTGSGYSTITVDISSIGRVDKLKFVRGTVYENNDNRVFDIPYFRIADSESLLYECRVNSDNTPYLVLFVRASSGAGYSLSDLSVTLQYIKSA